MIPRLTSLLASLVLATLAPLAAAQAVVDVAGVRYEPVAQLGGAKLQLNGAGVRYKAIFKVYTAGLYLQNKAATPEAVLAAQGPKRMHIVMLRDIDANELGKLFTRGMQDNSPREEFAKSINGTLKLADLFAAKKKLTAGEFFTVDYVPGTGTTVVVNGKPGIDPIVEPEFFQALVRIWLGQRPADPQLKDALLGKAAPTREPFNN